MPGKSGCRPLPGKRSDGSSGRFRSSRRRSRRSRPNFSPVSQRLETIPGVGFVTATAIAASVADPSAFRSARQFAAWLGLVPRQNSSGGKERLGGITKMGDKSIRNLLVLGATGTVRYARTKGTALATWITKLVERKPARLATGALANKIARIAWAVMARGEDYRPTAPTAA